MKTLYLIILASLLLPTIAHAQIEDMEIRSKGDVYYLGFIKVYDAYLLSNPFVDTSNILDPSVSKCLRLEYSVALTPEQFIEGANRVLERQYDSETLSSLQNEIDLLHDNYQPVEKGDTYTLCYDADTETTGLALNGQELVSISSPQFSRLYFGIWLSPDSPLDKKLQRSLVASNS